MTAQPAKSVPLFALLALYFVCALSYSLICGLLGRSYSPLAAFQVYSLALAPALVASMLVGRATGVWRWRRAWPPTAPETRAAAASVVILTASTLMYLSAQSLVAVLVAQAGCLLLVVRWDRPHTIALCVTSFAAVTFSVAGKPQSLSWTGFVIPVALGIAKTAGYYLKIGSVESAKSGEGASQASVTAGQVSVATARSNDRIVSPDDFLAAEQVLVSILALVVGALASHHSPPAPLVDWRLWAVAAASLGMGLFGTRIMLRREELGVTFPAYRMASLVAAFGAALSRGELRWDGAHWPSWIACLLACGVVACVALPESQRTRIGAWFGSLASGFQRARLELQR